MATGGDVKVDVIMDAAKFVSFTLLPGIYDSSMVQGPNS